jgi:hypothetical protein
MKHVITILFLALATSVSAQTTRIVDANPNRPSGPNYYATLQAAINAATDDDVIIITPNANVYSGTLNKRLHLIGPGIDISKNDDRMLAQVNVSIGTVSASGSSFRGLYVTNISQSNYVSSGSSVVSVAESVAFNLYSATNSSAGAIITFDIRNSYLYNYDIHGTIQNSIMGGNGTLRSGVCRNNIAIGFYNFGPGFNPNTPTQIRVSVYNNIFLTNSIGSATHTSFTRNVFDRVYAPNLVNSANTFTENITGEELDPRFVQGSLSELNTALSNLLGGSSFEGNYRLASNSPGKNFGTDGTDVGIYGGTYPFVQLDRGIRVLPSVRRLNVSGVVREGGEIRIEGTVSNASNN